MEKKMMGLSWSLGVLGLVVFIAMANYSVHAMTCSQALVTLMPCKPFLTGPQPKPLPACCIAVTKVNDAAKTTQDRRDLCKCFEKEAPGLGVKPDKAKQLPKLCGITVPVPIDPSVNCENIQ